MALGQLLPVRAQDHRQVRELRHRGAQRLVDVDLARGVVHVVIATDHLGDAHVDVVDHHREVVGGKAIRTEDHEVVELFVRPLDPPLHLVVEHDAARGGVLEADDPVRIVAVRLVAITVIAVVARLHAVGHRLVAHGLDLVLGLVGVVGLALAQQLVGHFAVTVHAQGLVVRALVMGQAQPAHAVENRLHGLVGGALAIGVLDAQDEFATAAAGLQPAIQRRAGTADVEVAGGTGGKTGADGHRGSSISDKRTILPCRSAPCARPIRNREVRPSPVARKARSYTACLAVFGDACHMAVMPR